MEMTPRKQRIRTGCLKKPGPAPTKLPGFAPVMVRI